MFRSLGLVSQNTILGKSGKFANEIYQVKEVLMSNGSSERCEDSTWRMQSLYRLLATYLLCKLDKSDITGARKLERLDADSLIRILDQEAKNFDLVQKFLTTFWRELSLLVGPAPPPRIDLDILSERNLRIEYTLKSLITLGVEVCPESL